MDIKQIQNGQGVCIDMQMIQRKDVPNKGFRTFELASTISGNTVTRGTSGTMYALQPVKWLREQMEAAKFAMTMQPITRQAVLEAGNSQLTIPVEKRQMPSSGWETSESEVTTANTDLAHTDIVEDDGVLFEPEDAGWSVALTNKSLRKNALNLVATKKMQLQDKLSWEIDSAILTAIRPASGGIAEMSNTALGVQTIFGGVKTTNAGDNLDDGDIMTPAVIKRMRKLLKSKVGYYWTGNEHTPSAYQKNPHKMGIGGDFYLIINADSEEALLNSSQFTNAAEKGDSETVKSGVIGKYLGVNVVSDDLLATYTASDTVYVQGATVDLDVAAHEAFMVKQNYYAGLVWGQSPKFYIFDEPARRRKTIVSEMSYQAKALYPDSIVRAILANE